MFTGSKAGQVTVGDETHFSFRCWPTECEYLRSMNGAVIINLVEISEQYNNFRTRFFQTAVKNKIWPVTRRYWASYRRPIRIFQKGEVRTRLACWNEESVLWYSQVWVKGQLCAEVVAHVMVIDKKSKRGITEIQRLMGKEVPSPPMPKEVAALLESHALKYTVS